MVFSSFFLALLLCINFFVPSITFHATRSLDGSGDFKTMGAAISTAPNNSNLRFYIRVKPGTYRERVEIPLAKKFIALIGDNALTTIIVDDKSNDTGFKTNNFATLSVKDHNFMTQSLTFENSADPQNGHAVVVLNHSDYAAYYKCRFVGSEDTLIQGKNLDAHPMGRVHLSFFHIQKGKNNSSKECDIYGSVDFIFGNGLAVFQDCNVYAWIVSKDITITAQSKHKEPTLKSGLSFQNCTITVSPEDIASVVFMESFLDDVVAPDG